MKLDRMNSYYLYIKYQRVILKNIININMLLIEKNARNYVKQSKIKVLAILT